MNALSGKLASAAVCSGIAGLAPAMYAVIADQSLVLTFWPSWLSLTFIGLGALLGGMAYRTRGL